MNLRCLSLVGIGVVSLAIAPWALAQQEVTRPPRVDYFRVYAVKPLPVRARVDLQGQFDKQKRTVALTELNHLATPVRKGNEPIVDKNAHLAWYSIRSPVREPNRRVLLRNQFGDQEFVLGPSVMLAVPTEKVEKESAISKTLDHYLCYRVLEGKELTKVVALADQFDQQRSVRVTRPLYFCVPVMKIHADKVTKVLNPKLHLTVYAIPSKAYELKRGLVNQFGKYEVTILKSEMLAVPSQKLRWSEVTP